MQDADLAVMVPALLAGAALGALATALIAWALARRAWRRSRAAEQERLSSLRHDLRTPLSSITACSEILLDEDDPRERARFLEIIHAEAQRMETMIASGGGVDASGIRPAAVAVPPPRAAADTPPAEAKDAAAAGRTVLVVDDDRFIVEATRTLLAREGFRCLGAGGGEEALRRAREDHPDLILMDLRMPAMGGDDALRRLRGDPATRGIPVIITTGDGETPVPEGAAVVLSKPISKERLLGAIDDVLKARPGAIPGGEAR